MSCDESCDVSCDVSCDESCAVSCAVSWGVSFGVSCGVSFDNPAVESGDAVNLRKRLSFMSPSAPVTIFLSETFVDRFRSRLDPLMSVGRGLQLRVLTNRPSDPDDAEAAFLSPDEFPSAPAGVFRTALKAPSLAWFHTLSAGVDHPAFGALVDRGVRLTTSSGAAAVPIAQAVFMNVLALTRNLPKILRNQVDRNWDRLPGADLAGHTMVIAGMGPIGIEVARLAAAFGMRAVGLRRTVTGAEPCETWTLDRWNEALAIANFAVLALPLTPDTRLLLNAQAISHMRHGAIVVNVGRGELIDEPAMINALNTGQIGAAALDVTTIEPLPPDSPLWAMENVIITPHNSSAIPSTNAAVVDIFFDNLGRYLRGETLRNEVGLTPR